MKNFKIVLCAMLFFNQLILAECKPCGTKITTQVPNPFVAALDAKYCNIKPGLNNCVTRSGLVVNSFGVQKIDMGNLVPNPVIVLTQQVRVLDDGRIILRTNIRDTAGVNYIVITRLTPNGSLDATWNATSTTPGHVILNAGLIQNTGQRGLVAFVSRGVEFQKDGLTLVASPGRDATLGDVYIVWRLLVNGQLDTAFGNQGKIVVPFIPGGSVTAVNSLALAQDGSDSFFIAGGAFPAGGAILTPDSRIGVAKFFANGQPDTSFGTNGLVLILGNVAGIRKIIALPSGYILGYAQGLPLNSTLIDIFGFRLLSSGTLDISFGQGTGVSFVGMVSRTGRATGGIGDMHIRNDSDQIVLTAFVTTNPRSAYAVQRQADGVVDRNFGENDGILPIPAQQNLGLLPITGYDVGSETILIGCCGILIVPVVGQNNDLSVVGGGLVALNRSGNVVQSFGNNGTVDISNDIVPVMNDGLAITQIEHGNYSGNIMVAVSTNVNPAERQAAVFILTAPK